MRHQIVSCRVRVNILRVLLRQFILIDLPHFVNLIEREREKERALAQKIEEKKRKKNETENVNVYFSQNFDKILSSSQILQGSILTIIIFYIILLYNSTIVQ